MDKLINSNNINVVTVGTGTPMTTASRVNACTVILGGNDFILVDVGPGSTKNMLSNGMDLSKVTGVLLTHFHSDHIGDLGEINLQSWARGRSKPLRVYGPPGVEDIVEGFNQAYKLDCEHREEHHGKQIIDKKNGKMNYTILKHYKNSDGQTFTITPNGVEITIFEVDHGPVKPSTGYKFKYQEKTVVISGDTKFCNNLIKHAMNCDLLVHEVICCQLISYMIYFAEKYVSKRNAVMLEDTLNYHTSYEDCTKICNITNAKSIVFTHIVPPLPGFIVKVAFYLFSRHSGPSVPNWFANDMDVYTVYKPQTSAKKLYNHNIIVLIGIGIFLSYQFFKLFNQDIQ